MLAALCDKVVTHTAVTAASDGALGTTKTPGTQTATNAAIWPAGVALARDLYGTGFTGTHVVATAESVGAKADDWFTYGGEYYVVQGVQVFSNAGVSGEVLYLHDTVKRVSV